MFYIVDDKNMQIIEWYSEYENLCIELLRWHIAIMSSALCLLRVSNAVGITYVRNFDGKSG